MLHPHRPAKKTPHVYNIIRIIRRIIITITITITIIIIIILIIMMVIKEGPKTNEIHHTSAQFGGLSGQTGVRVAFSSKP